MDFSLRLWLAFVLLAVGDGAWGGENRPAHMLDWVPADTPLLWTVSEREPENWLADTSQEDEQLQRVRFVVRYLLQSNTTDGPDADSERRSRLYTALLDALDGRTSRQAFLRFGFRHGDPLVIYLAQGRPAIRIRLSDPAALQARLRQLERAWGAPFDPVLGFEGTSWYFKTRAGQVSLALQDDHLAILWTPLGSGDDLPRRLLAAPEQAYGLASQRTFEQDGGFTPYGSGFLDTRQVLRAVTDPLSWVAMAGWVPKTWTADCTAAVDRWLQQVTRIEFGVNEAQGRQIGLAVRIRFDAALDTQLATWRGALPRQGADPAVAEVDLGLDVFAAIAGLKALSLSGAEQATACPALAGWQHGLQALSDAVDPYAPSLRGLRGGSLRFGAATPQADILSNLTLAFVADQATTLKDLLQAAVPQLGLQSLKADGKVRLLAADSAFPAFSAVLQPQLLAASSAAKARSTLRRLARAPLDTEPALLRVRVERAFMERMGEAEDGDLESAELELRHANSALTIALRLQLPES